MQLLNKPPRFEVTRVYKNTAAQGGIVITLLFQRKKPKSKVTVNGTFYINQTADDGYCFITSPSASQIAAGAANYRQTGANIGTVKIGNGAAIVALLGLTFGTVKRNGVFMNGNTIVFENFELPDGHNAYWFLSGASGAADASYDLTFTEHY